MEGASADDEGCLGPDRAMAYVEGLLSADERAAADAHMDQCGRCRWLVSRLARPALAMADTVARPAPASGVDTAPLRGQHGGSPGPGARVGRYQIARSIGAGGMGAVYAARDPELDREVAIKLLRVGGGAQLEGQARLLREAQAMARLAHPGVVPIYDVGATGDGVFLAMELVDGQDARRWLDETRPTWRHAVAVLVGAGRGLAAAHGAGIVHRDVKPANVLVGRDGRARVTDFGLARTTPRTTDASGKRSPIDASVGEELAAIAGAAAGTSGPRRPIGDEDTAPPATVTARADSTLPPGEPSPLDGALTTPGAILGTPAYMAPEQHRGLLADARADQFSFCVVLYEAVYGERPFAPPPHARPVAAALAAEVLAGRVRPPPARTAVPTWLRRILLRGLAVDPDQRWPSMTALLDAIRDTPARRRRPLLAAGAAAAIIALAGAFAAGRADPAADDEARCTRAARAIETTWSPHARADALARITTLGPYGASVAPHLAQQLGGFATRWSAGHRDACLAHRRGAQSDDLLDRRMACLERGRAAFAAVAEIVATVDVARLPDASLATQALPDPAACGDLAALLADGPVPPTAIAARVAAVASSIERAKVLVAAGRFAEARTTAIVAVGAARVLGYEPILAEALLTEGRARMNLTPRLEAAPALTEATSIALHTGADALAVEAWARRAWTQATAEDSAHALDGIDLITAIAARPRATGFARALLQNNIGTVALARGDRAAARASFERALAEARSATGPAAIELVNVRGNLALVTDDPVRRDALLVEAERELTARVGADHPQTLTQRLTRAMWTPRLDRARAILSPVCTAYEELHPSLVAYAVSCWAELGFISEELGDRSGARAALERARPIDAPSSAAIAEVAGYRALWSGDAPGATRRFTAAAAELRRTPDERWATTLNRARSELGLGRAQRTAGDRGAALTTLRRVVVDLEGVLPFQPSPFVNRRLARARAELVATLGAAHGNPAEIVATALAAAGWLRVEGGRADEIAALEGLAAAP